MGPPMIQEQRLGSQRGRGGVQGGSVGVQGGFIGGSEVSPSLLPPCWRALGDPPIDPSSA